MNREHPAPGWELTVHRLVESPGCAALQLTLAHAEGVDHGACFYVVSRGHIREATELWAERLAGTCLAGLVGRARAS